MVGVAKAGRRHFSHGFQKLDRYPNYDVEQAEMQVPTIGTTLLHSRTTKALWCYSFFVQPRIKLTHPL